MDEIPGYGVGRPKIRQLREILGLWEKDLALLIVNTREKAKRLLGFVVRKLKLKLEVSDSTLPS